VEGLDHAGVEVVFVVPRAYGDEQAGRARVIGGDGVQLNKISGQRATAQSPSSVSVLAGVGSAPLDKPVSAQASESCPGLVDESSVEATSSVRTVMVESPLRPYQNAESYSDYVQGLEADGKRVATDEAQFLGHQLNEQLSAGQTESYYGAAITDPAAWEALALNAAKTAKERFLRGEENPEAARFTGGYGADLFGEVARYAQVVAEIALREKVDLVHAHDWMTYPAGVAAARALGVPLLVHVHATEFDRSGENPDPRVFALERMGMHLADRIVCVSHFTGRTVRYRHGADPDKIRVLHNAVTQREQRDQWHTACTVKGPIILYLGRVTMQKGPDYFLQAAAKVVKLRPDVNFVLSGSGDMLPPMMMRSARLGLARNMFFTGFLRGKEVERMYSMADLYVMPSVSEPFGITPLEAMALDVPVIVSKQSGVSEIVANALKVDYWDVDELANKMLAVISYAPLRQQLIDQGREEVGRMRWEVRGGLLRTYYEELVA
jgi:glycosyltransferase involved in cell wall biosynthesis